MRKKGAQNKIFKNQKEFLYYLKMHIINIPTLEKIIDKSKITDLFIFIIEDNFDHLDIIEDRMLKKKRALVYISDKKYKKQHTNILPNNYQINTLLQKVIEVNNNIDKINLINIGNLDFDDDKKYKIKIDYFVLDYNLRHSFLMSTEYDNFIELIDWMIRLKDDPENIGLNIDIFESYIEEIDAAWNEYNDINYSKVKQKLYEENKNLFEKYRTKCIANFEKTKRINPLDFFRTAKLLNNILVGTSPLQNVKMAINKKFNKLMREKKIIISFYEYPFGKNTFIYALINKIFIYNMRTNITHTDDPESKKISKIVSLAELYEYNEIKNIFYWIHNDEIMSEIIKILHIEVLYNILKENPTFYFDKEYIRNNFLDSFVSFFNEYPSDLDEIETYVGIFYKNILPAVYFDKITISKIKKLLNVIKINELDGFFGKDKKNMLELVSQNIDNQKILDRDEQLKFIFTYSLISIYSFIYISEHYVGFLLPELL